MGRLKQLLIEDFKSYKGKHIVGKSNMMDAISFVLGVQSKHLRSSQLKELIFKADSTSKVSTASVTLVYEVSSDEFEDKTEGEELVFSRSISQSGSSIYRFNKKEISHESYDETLQKLGLLVKAKNFLVFQGDVESLASKSPNELTFFIEQISGSDQYRQEYISLTSQKESSEESLLFLMQKKKMYAGQCKEAKVQKDEADLYNRKKVELSNLKRDHVLWQVWRLETNKNEHLENLNKFLSDLENIRVDEEKLDNEIRSIKTQLTNVNKSLTSLEKGRNGKSKSLANISPELESIRNKIKSTKKRIVELESSESSVQADRDEQLANIELLKQEISKLEVVETHLRMQLEGEENIDLLVDAQKVAEYSRLRERVSGRTATQTTEEKTIEQEISTKNLYIQGLESQQHSLTQEISLTDRQIHEYSERIGKLRNALIDGEKDRDALQLERDRIRQSMVTGQSKLTELETESDNLSSKLREAGEDKKRSKNDERILEAIDTMKKIYSGVYGKLLDICRPIQKKYAQAITVAAGNNIDAIVVDTKQTAAECIRYLKDQRLGTCLFLPLNNITSTAPPERLRSLGGKYKLCVDLVEYEEMYKPAINYAFGTTVVCETLEDAQDLCFQRREPVRAVTLRGYVISRSGAMTGGVASVKDGYDRWEEKDLENSRKKKAEVDESILKLRQTIPSRQQLLDIETKLKMLQTKMQYSEADLRVATEKFEQFQQQKSLKEKTLQSLIENLNEVKKTIAGLRSRLTELRDHIREVENEIFAEFSLSVGVQNIREYEENRLKVHQQNISKRKEVSERKIALTSQLEYESKRDFVGGLQRLRQQLSEARSNLKKLEQDEKSILKREQQLKKEVEELSADVNSKTTERNTITVSFKTLQNHRNTIVSDKESIAKRISGEEIIIEKARNQLREIIQKASIDEVQLPIISEEEESEQMEETVVRDTDGVPKIDLSSMRKYRNYNKNELLEFESNLLKHMAEISSELETIQPNMHASDRYQTLIDKLNECNEELESARESSRKMSERFEEVKSLRQQLFHDCYRHVSEALGVIYKDLTRSSKYPLGGNAYLTLDNTEEPFSGGMRFTAMPPMKRFRDMEQLSGGEKTIAALALLFSIHSYRQAPFFVLDEVDAALDNVNVRKVCNYLQQRSKDFQCIVISLKDFFFENADCLIGICKDVRSMSSRVLTLNLKKYDTPGGFQGQRGRFAQIQMTPESSSVNETPSDTSRRSTPKVGGIGISQSSSPLTSKSRGSKTRKREEHDESETPEEETAIGKRQSRSRRVRESIAAAIAEEDEGQEED